MHKTSGILLDTHVWIWLNNGSSELTTKTVDLIDEYARKGALFIAAISVWEFATLVAKNRIILRTSPQDWVNEALSQPGVELIQMTPAISIESTQLPDDFHGDPADRILVATARLHSLSLLTRDKKICDYAKKGFLKVQSI